MFNRTKATKTATRTQTKRAPYGMIEPRKRKPILSPAEQAQRDKVDRYRTGVVTRRIADFLIGAALLMLALGALHGHYHRLPAISFKDAMLVELAIWAVLPAGLFDLSDIKNIIEVEKGYK